MSALQPLVAADALCGCAVSVDADQRPAEIRAELNRPDVVFVVTAVAPGQGRRFVGLVSLSEIAQHPQRIFGDLVGSATSPLAADTPLDAVLQQFGDLGVRAIAVRDHQGEIGAVTQTSVQRALLARERDLLAQATADAAHLTVWSSRLEDLHGAAKSLLQLLGEHLLEQDTLQQAIDVLTRLLDARYGALALLDRDQRIKVFVHTGLTAAEVSAIGAPPTGQGLLGVVVREDGAIRLDDLGADPRSSGFPPHHPPMKTLLAVPISHRGDGFGRIYLCEKHSGAPFTADDERLARCLADSVAAMLVSARALEYQRHLEAQLRQGQKLEAIGRLAGGIAHDFNNLLTVITCSAEMINAAATDLPAQVRRSTADIGEATTRAAALTHQLLTFGRQGGPVEVREVDLNTMVTETTRMVARLLGDLVVVETVLEAELPQVRVDPTQLTQIVMNLAINARDAMATGGTLTIITRSVAVARDVIPGAPDGAAVQLLVRDTGTGIAAEDLPHVFEPYFTTKASGTGLGLATTYGIIKQAGGHIEVTSGPDQGACFVVSLPAVASRARPPVTAPQMAVTGHGETVLVTEDSPVVLRLIAAALAQHGYTVLSAPNGRLGLEVAHGHEAALRILVTDVDMAEFGGVGLAEQLRQRIPDLKVLFITGAASVALGPFDDLLLKPFTAVTVAQRVRALLDRR